MSTEPASDRSELSHGDGRIGRPIGLRFIGDPGAGNLTRVCGWLAHELHERSLGAAYSTLRTGDAGAANLRALGRGEVDLALVTPSAVATLAVRGEGPFGGEGYPYLRALGELPHPDRLLFAARADLGVSSVAELRERRLPLRLSTSLDGPGASFVGFAVERVLAAAGLAPDTLRNWGGEVITRDSPPACLAEFDVGSDAVLHEGIMGPWWLDLDNRHELAYLSFEPEVLAAVEAELACAPAQVPGGYFEGLKQPVDTVDFKGYLVVVREDMAPDVAFLLTWILAETAARFVAMNYRHVPANRSPIAYPVEREALRQAPIPLHPAAAEYYEKPR